MDIGNAVAAIGALGTASFALVDGTKLLRDGGISNSGFIHIESAVRKFFPNASRKLKGGRQKSERELLDILHGNWINGTALADQKAIAKSLIKLRLNDGTAAAFADATDVDAAVMKSVAQKMTNGQSLEANETNVLGRFDLALTAMLDEGYNRADQKYRNRARGLASLVAVVLAVLGGWSLGYGFWTPDMAKTALCGVLATPLAPISKDLTTALAAAVKVAQTVRK